MNQIKLFTLLFIALSVVSCNNGGNNEENAIEYSDFDIFAEVENDEMVFVEGGDYMMGKVPHVLEGTKVELSDFYIGKYEVTQRLWEYVMSYSGTASDGSILSPHSDIWLGPAPSTAFGSGEGDNYPIYGMSYNQIITEFIPRLNKITGKSFRLPTEAEWEYAARGVKKSNGYTFSGSNEITEVANYYNPYTDRRESNCTKKTTPVGSKASNELGIYDMSGNLSEWCSDWLGGTTKQPQKDPKGPSSGSERIIRGGNCFSNSNECRVFYRACNKPDTEANGIGFRLAHSVE